ncbi:MAG: sigma 54-interacting transcriptional regulator [Schleiferiaceae bacterium]|nr:sigma 54-interacting transcriptional regulator [Schleiferiaceae bacterium]
MSKKVNALPENGVSESAVLSSIERVEGELARANQLLTKSFEIANIAICMVGLDGKFININEMGCQLFGYTKSEMLDKTFIDLTYPEDIPVGVNFFKDAIEGKRQHIQFKKRYFHKNGELIHAKVSSTIIKDREQKPLHFFTYLLDETKELKAVEALEKSKSHFESIVEDQTEMIVRWKADGERTFVNDAYCRTYGLNRKEAIGTSYFQDFSKMNLEFFKRKIKSIIPERPIAKDVQKVTLPNGEISWQEWTDRGFFNESGEVVEYQSVGRDITLQKQIELELLEQTNRLNLIYNTTSEFMGLIRIEGELLYIESVNKVFEEVNRARGKSFSAEDVKDMQVQFFLTNIMELDKSLVQSKIAKYKQVISTKESLRYTEKMEFNNHVSVTDNYLKPIFKNNKVTHVLWVSRDVTESYEATQKLNDSYKQVKILKAQLEQENVELKEELNLKYEFENMIYAGDVFKQVLDKIESVAQTDATVLIEGETGTGKELVARAIHNISNRSSRNLIKVNCAAIPKELIESELFGHKKGAFTGAVSDRKGKFELAHGGTIFLDEIGELPIELQPKLLRVLQEGEIEVVGDSKVRNVDVRVVAATNRNLKIESEKGNFREDLFFRLNVFPIGVPSLKERKEDIPSLVEHFTAKYSAKYNKSVKYISDEALAYLTANTWPGNIRELENVIERGVILSKEGRLVIPEAGVNESSQKIEDCGLTLAEVQRIHITKVLNNCHWKIDGENGAAQILDLKSSTLRDRMKKLGIKRPS